jgi:G3E family GTPase
MIPCHLVTGFLGVGKTTALLNLLRRRPLGSRWAVIVNEFGEVGIDGAIFEAEGDSQLDIREVTGGCVCCTSLPMFEIHLALLLQDQRPERIFIETSGLAHPARILDQLRNPHYADRLEIAPTIALISPHDFLNPAMRDSIVFMDQAMLADILLLNKRDEATPATLQQFQDWADLLYPPKLLVAATQEGVIDPAWLELRGSTGRLALFADAHNHAAPGPTPPTENSGVPHPKPGQPVRRESESGEIPACGWIFHEATIFDEDRLSEFILALPAARFKGVFRIDADEWVLFNRAGGRLESRAVFYRRDSRCECFAAGLNWLQLEHDLLSCIRG